MALFFAPMLASLKFTAVRGGVRFGFFETGSWLRLRDWRAGLSAGARILLTPVFAALFLALFHAHYVRQAWSDARQAWSALPLGFRILNAHNILLQLVLALVLPYVARWIGIAIGYEVGVLRRVWAELRSDFRASARWVRIAALPFWLVRAIFSLPLPHLLIPWPWLFLFHSRSWARVRDDFRGRSALGLSLIHI